MGTNYYQIIDPCKCCNRGSEEIHIGKSSAGWPFSVHVIPEMEIYSWDDWMKRLEGAKIKDEYGREISLHDLNELVVRKRVHKNDPHVLEGYENYPNHARPDPKTGDKLTSGEFF